MKVNVLGQEYEIVPEKEMRIDNCDGYCDDTVKKIVINDFKKEEKNQVEDIDYYKRQVVRHELVHAFLFESGLSHSSDWATNEEIVDWVARQLPKMAKVMKDIEVL